MSKLLQFVRSSISYLSYWICFCSGFALGHFTHDLIRHKQKNLTSSISNPQLVPNKNVPALALSVPGVLTTALEALVPESPLAIRGRNVGLYLLWNQRFAPAQSSPTNGIWQNWESIGSWSVWHLAWQPDSTTKSEEWYNSEEVLQAITKLCHYADPVVQQIVSDHAAQEQAVFPVYSVLQIGEIAEREAFLSPLASIRRWTWRTNKKQRILSARRAFMQHILSHLEASKEQTQSEWSSAIFSHYNEEKGERGWIIMHHRQAFVAGMSDSQSRTLINLLHQRDMAKSTDPDVGIVPAYYEDVLIRIGQWNSTQDMRETVDQLTNLVNSGQKSTDGQVLLNLALAFIGILVSFAAAASAIQGHLWSPLIFLGIASLFFWGYARFGQAIWQILGFLAVFCALFFYFSWYDTLYRIFMYIFQK